MNQNILYCYFNMHKNSAMINAESFIKLVANHLLMDSKHQYTSRTLN